MAVIITIGVPDEVHQHYETMAQTTGRTRNELMVEALRDSAERQMCEIAMIQEGLAQARADLSIPIEEALIRFKGEGMLPADYMLS